ncbi:MAG: hypothetical protein SGPRY_006007 [Prymnesium sp.]
MQSASLKAMQAKHIATMAYAKKLEDEKFDPAGYPLLIEPKKYDANKRKRDASRADNVEGGSATLRDLHEKGKQRRAEAASKEACLQERREARASKRTAAEALTEEIRAGFSACKQQCVQFAVRSSQECAKFELVLLPEAVDVDV